MKKQLSIIKVSFTLVTTICGVALIIQPAFLPKILVNSVSLYIGLSLITVAGLTMLHSVFMLWINSLDFCANTEFWEGSDIFFGDKVVITNFVNSTEENKVLDALMQINFANSTEEDKDFNADEVLDELIKKHLIT